MKKYLIAALLILVLGGLIYLLSVLNTSTPRNDKERGVAVANPATSSESEAGSQLMAEHPLYGKRTTLEMLFLGKVPAYVQFQKVHLALKNEPPLDWSWEIYRDANGNFMRAEYRLAGAIDYRHDRMTNEQNYRAADEKIVGVPTEPPKLPIDQLIKEVATHFSGRGKLARATVIEINYVIYECQYSDGSYRRRNCYIVNAFGIDAVVSVARDTPRLLRLRLLLDEDLNAMFCDNNL